MEKYTSDEKRIFNEYIVADYNCRKKGAVTVTLIPTYTTTVPKQITLDDHLNARKKMLDTDSCIWNIGSLITLTKDGKIKPVKYDMRKCDIMLVTGAYDATEIVRTLTLMGKKFGSISMYLSKEFTQLWEQKFFDTKRGDIVLVRPQQGYSNNEYKILRNFTTEKMISAFFKSQRQI